MSKIADYYDEKYFIKQSPASETQGRLNLFKFQGYYTKDDTVLDFGCGSGSLLRAIGSEAKNLVGIEINDVAAKYARSHGTTVFKTISEVCDSSVDLVISNHALEHVQNPFEVAEHFLRVLKPQGRCIIVVPCDRASFPFNENDFDQHLFSWSAGNLGNLLKAVGFKVEKAEEISHKWPPKWQIVHRVLGDGAFHGFSKLWSRFDRSRSQVRVIAIK